MIRLKSNSKNYLLVFIFLLLSACGQGIGTAPPSSPFVQEGVTALNLGGRFPSDIDIVNHPDLQDIAFITLTEPPAVIAINLDTLTRSNNFVGLKQESLSGLGFPKDLFIVDPAHAFLLTSGGPNIDSVIYFNPSDGSVYDTIRVGGIVNLVPAKPVKQIDGSGTTITRITGSFSPSLPASLIVVGNKLIVSFSNLYYNQNGKVDHAIQGVVRIFEIKAMGSRLEEVGYVPTQCGNNDPDSENGFNATGLTALSNGKVLVTCTGLTERNDQTRTSIAITHGGVDLLDPTTEQVVSTLDVGPTAPAFRSWAVKSNGEAYIGSSAYDYLIKINISGDSLTLVGDPIKLSENDSGKDYFINDVVLNQKENRMYVMSVNENAVFTLNVQGLNPVVLPGFLNLSFKESAGGISGAGPAALRPGSPGTDFSGPDLFVLTGSPATLAAIQTY